MRLEFSPDSQLDLIEIASFICAGQSGSCEFVRG